MVVALVGVAWPVLLAAAVVPAAQEWFARRRARRERLAQAKRNAEKAARWLAKHPELARAERPAVVDADGRPVGRMRAEAERDGGERP